MNKAEAIQYMRSGYKVIHRYFSDEEWMSINPENGKVLTEEGYEHTFSEFFSYRTADGWEDGYELYKSKKEDLSITDQYLITNQYCKISEHINQMKDWGKSRKEIEAKIVPVRTTPKIGRNELCSCGSGKKNKHCTCK